MGTWGPGLYQNDISEDVKIVFRDQLRRGKTGDIITQELIKAFQAELCDSDDSFDFWCALADTQWDMGRLLPYVKEKALEHLDRGESAKRWCGANTKQINKRKQVLEQLRMKLHTPQPSEKKVVQYNPYNCLWKVGDVFALPIAGEFARTQNYEGHFLLIQKVSERQWHPVHTIPVVYLKIAKRIPANIEEYNQLEFVQTWATPYSEKHFAEDNSKEITPEQITAKHDYLPEYRIALITTSRRAIPSQLQFVANYSNAVSPANEYIPDDQNNTTSVSWKDLSSRAVELFLLHNKRQLDIYTPQNHNKY